jgi:uncharacterized protein YdeI (YjbR/CyaY-like superfamily)
VRGPLAAEPRSAHRSGSAILTGMAAGRDLPILEPPDSAAWASWLESPRSAGVWLKIAKKGSPKATLTQAQAVDEAIFYGWIDGQLRRHDEHFFLQRFTPMNRRATGVPDDCQAALNNHPGAGDFFETLGRAERYSFLYRLHHTKDPERRAERIAHYIELLGQRKTLGRG